jgi:hypothetical protein
LPSYGRHHNADFVGTVRILISISFLLYLLETVGKYLAQYETLFLTILATGRINKVVLSCTIDEKTYRIQKRISLRKQNQLAETVKNLTV